jgi:hypothetical protein
MKETVLTRYVWLFFVAITVLNALFVKFRSWKQIQQRPELAKGYQRLFNGILFWGNLPWFVMGLGIVSGIVPGIFSYLRPRDGNPLVLAWFATVVGVLLLGFRWIFAQGGAEFLAEHPGLIRGSPRDPKTIRSYYALMATGGILGVLILFFTKIPQLTQ